MMTEQGQSFLASAIYRAFKEYKNEIEKTSVVYNSTTNKTVKSDDEKKDPGILFRVQVKSSTDKIKKDAPVFQGYTDIKEYHFKGIYKYYVGESADFNEIIKLQNQIRGKIPDAFVVAFKNDERITINEAMKEIGRN